jgi:hypothetical protein
MNADGGLVPQPEQAIFGRTPQVRVQRAVRLGMGAALTAAVVGLLMALQRRETGCAGGTFFPEGATDFRCFEHPQGYAGLAVVATSIALGCLVFLVGVMASRSVPSDAEVERHPTS